MRGNLCPQGGMSFGGGPMQQMQSSMPAFNAQSGYGGGAGNGYGGGGGGGGGGAGKLCGANGATVMNGPSGNADVDAYRKQHDMTVAVRARGHRVALGGRRHRARASGAQPQVGCERCRQWPSAPSPRALMGPAGGA